MSKLGVNCRTPKLQFEGEEEWLNQGESNQIKVNQTDLYDETRTDAMVGQPHLNGGAAVDVLRTRTSGAQNRAKSGRIKPNQTVSRGQKSEVRGAITNLDKVMRWGMLRLTEPQSKIDGKTNGMKVNQTKSNRILVLADGCRWTGHFRLEVVEGETDKVKSRLDQYSKWLEMNEIKANQDSKNIFPNRGSSVTLRVRGLAGV